MIARLIIAIGALIGILLMRAFAGMAGAYLGYLVAGFV